jgi:hypothetical protein
MIFVQKPNVAGFLNVVPVLTGARVLVCPTFSWPRSISPEILFALYKWSYQQAIATLAPSRFQRLLEPSMN